MLKKKKNVEVEKLEVENAVLREEIYNYGRLLEEKEKDIAKLVKELMSVRKEKEDLEQRIEKIKEIKTKKNMTSVWLYGHYDEKYGGKD